MNISSTTRKALKEQNSKRIHVGRLNNVRGILLTDSILRLYCQLIEKRQRNNGLYVASYGFVRLAKSIRGASCTKIRATDQQQYKRESEMEKRSKNVRCLASNCWLVFLQTLSLLRNGNHCTISDLSLYLITYNLRLNGEPLGSISPTFLINNALITPDFAKAECRSSIVGYLCVPARRDEVKR